MSPNRVRLVLLGTLAGSALLFFVVATVGLNLLAGESHKLVDLKQQSKTADAASASLSASKKQVEQYSYFNDIAKSVLPGDKDQAQAVLDIFSLADQSGIAIASVTFPASSLGAKAAPASGTKTSSSNAATTPATSAISQAKAVTGIAGLYSLELTITPQTGTGVPDTKKVTYPKFLDFLSRVEHDRRTAQITQVNIQPQSSDAGPSQFINFTMSINIFMKP